MRRFILGCLLLLAVTVGASTPSYWWNQMLVKPDAQQAQQFWFLPGTNMTFTYANNFVYLNASGGGGGGTSNYYYYTTNFYTTNLYSYTTNLYSITTNTYTTNVYTIITNVYTTSATGTLTNILCIYGTNLYNNPANGGPLWQIGADDYDGTAFLFRNPSQATSPDTGVRLTWNNGSYQSIKSELEFFWSSGPEMFLWFDPGINVFANPAGGIAWSSGNGGITFANNGVVGIGNTQPASSNILLVDQANQKVLTLNGLTCDGASYAAHFSPALNQWTLISSNGQPYFVCNPGGTVPAFTDPNTYVAKSGSTMTGSLIQTAPQTNFSNVRIITYSTNLFSGISATNDWGEVDISDGVTPMALAIYQSGIGSTLLIGYDGTIHGNGFIGVGPISTTSTFSGNGSGLTNLQSALYTGTATNLYGFTAATNGGPIAGSQVTGASTITNGLLGPLGYQPATNGAAIAVSQVATKGAILTNGNDFAISLSNRVSILTNRSMAFYIGTNPPAAPLTHSNVFQIDAANMAKALEINTNGNTVFAGTVTIGQSLNCSPYYTYGVPGVGYNNNGYFAIGRRKSLVFATTSSANTPGVVLSGSSSGNFIYMASNVVDTADSGTWPGFLMMGTNRPAILLTSGNSGAVSNQVGADFYIAGLSVATNGFVSKSRNLLAPVTISVGASPFNFTNSAAGGTGGTNNIFVFVDGSGVTGSIAVNGTTVFSALAGADATVPLQPGEYVTVTYTIGTPGMTWKPF